MIPGYERISTIAGVILLGLIVIAIAAGGITAG